jgi:hypothetical protein
MSIFSGFGLDFLMEVALNEEIMRSGVIAPKSVEGIKGQRILSKAYIKHCHTKFRPVPPRILLDAYHLHVQFVHRTQYIRCPDGVVRNIEDLS